MALCVWSWSALSAQLLDLRVGRHADFTRVVLDTSDEAAYETRRENSKRVTLRIDAAFNDDLVCCRELVGPDIVAASLVAEDRGVSALALTLATAREIRVFNLRPDEESGAGHRIVIDVPVSEGSVNASEVRPEQGTAQSRSQGAVSSDANSAVTASKAPEGLAAQGKELAPAGVARTELMDETRRETTTVSSPLIASDAAAPSAAEAPAPSRSRKIRETAVETVFSGTWRHQYAWATASSASQKFESFIEPRWDTRFSDSLALTAIGRVRLDAIGDLGPSTRKPANYSDISAPWFNSAEAELSLREFYLDMSLGSVDLRLGKQQIVWGQADGFKVLDVVNPQSFREFLLDDFDNSRIPLWSINAEVPVADIGTLQLIWIPDTTYHEFAEPGTPFALTTPRLIPQLPVAFAMEPAKPDDPLKDSDVGAAFSGFAGGWDYSVNYLYRYLDTPLLRVVPRETALQLVPEYARSHLIGGTFSNAFGALTLRGEVGFNSHSYHAANTLESNAVFESQELNAVVGVDWLSGGNNLLSVQWFVSHLGDYVDEINRDRSEQIVSATYQGEFQNGAWRLRATALHSLNDRDTQLQVRLYYWLASAFELHVGYDGFSGDEQGLFGQFGEQDRLLMGFEYSF